MNTTDKSYISTIEAAEELGVNPVFIRGEIKKGELKAFKISPRKYKIKKEDWESYISSKRV